MDRHGQDRGCATSAAPLRDARVSHARQSPFISTLKSKASPVEVWMEWRGEGGSVPK
jgi:hypothetical protein